MAIKLNNKISSNGIPCGACVTSKLYDVDHCAQPKIAIRLSDLSYKYSAKSIFHQFSATRMPTDKQQIRLEGGYKNEEYKPAP